MRIPRNYVGTLNAYNILYLKIFYTYAIFYIHCHHHSKVHTFQLYYQLHLNIVECLQYFSQYLLQSYFSIPITYFFTDFFRINNC